MARAEVHKDNLIQTAMRLFRKQGYASTGLQQILSDSGAPKGSLYHYFPEGKEALAVAATGRAGELVASMLRHAATENRQTTDFIAAYCQTMAGWMAESDFRSGCPIATAMLETAPQSPAMTRAGKSALNSWIDIIAKKFEQNGISKSDAKMAAYLLVSAMEGALILARVYESTEPILNVQKLFTIQMIKEESSGDES